MKILVIDDHEIVAIGLKIIIEKNYKKCNLEYTTDPEEGYSRCLFNKYDLIIMDVNIPDSNMMIVMTNILMKKPDTKILILSMNPDNIFAKQFLRKGAYGYINKDAPESELIKAIKMVDSGKRYLSKRLLEKISNDMFEKRTDNPFDKLSERELEICSYLVKGFSVTEISSIVQLHTSTIGTHKTRILNKTGVKNLLELRDIAKQYKIPTCN